MIIPERLRVRHWAGWEAAMTTGVTRYGDGQLLAVPALHKDKRQISIEFSIQLLKDVAGQIEWVVAVVRDVTDRFSREKDHRAPSDGTFDDLAAMPSEQTRTHATALADPSYTAGVVNPWISCAFGMFVVLLPPCWHAPSRSAADPPPFHSWRAALIQEAVDRGFERPLVEDLLGGLEPLPRVLQLDRSQAQHPSDLNTYLAERVTPDLIARGREMISRYAPALAQIEREFAVQPRFLVSIWGAETGYGRYTGDVPVLPALATLAWDRRRSSYFRAELFSALAIVSAGHIAPERMQGSWAGAMGQPQFMPSSYLEYAVDFDHDGRRDIWDSDVDVLASIANYLQRRGWDPNQTWGMEVEATPAVRARVEREVPRRTFGCGAIRVLTERRPFVEWAALGTHAADGSALPEARVTTGSLVLVDSRTFLVSPNYETVLGYNCSHRYALSVSMLADSLE